MRLSLHVFHCSYLIYWKQAGNNIVLNHSFTLIPNFWHDILKSAKFKQKDNREDDNVHDVLLLIDSVSRARWFLVEIVMKCCSE